MSGPLLFVCFILVSECVAQVIIWKDETCKFKDTSQKPIINTTGGFMYSGSCSADQFYNSWLKTCLQCPGTFTNCCENTFRTCYHDKTITGSCDWTKDQAPAPTYATPALKKATTAGVLPDNTSEAPCEDTDDNKTFSTKEHNIPTPMTHTASTPAATQASQDGHDRHSHTSAPKPQEQSTCIECWVVAGIMLLFFFVCLVMVIVYREDVVRKFNNLIRSVRERFNCGGPYAPGRIQRAG